MTGQATLTEYTKRSFRELMKDVATSIPGHILAFDPVTQMAQVQIGVVRMDIKGQPFEPSPLINVPVYFCGGVNFSIEYQIDPGDEGLIIFSQRCIDGWKSTGGVAQNPIMRFHDMSDAAFLPGIRSQPKVLPDFANNGLRIRNADATHHIWLKNDGTIIATNGEATSTLAPDGTITHNNGTVTDTLAPDGTITRTNGSGNITMAPDGTVNINGAIITPDGAISSPVSVTAPTVTGSTSLVVAGAEVKEHVHDKGTYLDAENRPLNSGNSGAL